MTWNLGTKLQHGHILKSLSKRIKTYKPGWLQSSQRSIYNPSGFSKIKVKLASQIFSHTLTAAINTYVYLQALLGDAIGTAQLIKHFDTLFDCCNSISFKDSKKCRCPLTTQVPHIGEVFNLCMTINAIVSIWKKIYQEGIASFLVMRQLNQDPLENFVGSIRQLGGNSDNPTPLHFIRAYRKLFHVDLLTVAGNCELDDNNLIAGLQDLDDKPYIFQSSHKSEPIEIV